MPVCARPRAQDRLNPLYLQKARTLAGGPGHRLPARNRRIACVRSGVSAGSGVRRRRSRHLGSARRRPLGNACRRRGEGIRGSASAAASAWITGFVYAGTHSREIFAGWVTFPGVSLQRGLPPRLILVAPALSFHPTTEAISRPFLDGRLSRYGRRRDGLAGPRQSDVSQNPRGASMIEL